MKTKIKIVWTIDDVFLQALNDDVSLNKKEASKVLSLLEKNHNAMIGINWDVISETIKIVEREKIK